MDRTQLLIFSGVALVVLYFLLTTTAIDNMTRLVLVIGLGALVAAIYKWR